MPEVAAVGAIAVRDGELLLIRRGRPPAAGRWSLPGGRVEPGETDVEAVVREVREETGLTVSVLRFVGEVTRPGEGDVVYQIRDFAVSVDDGLLVAGDDASDAAWVAVQDLGRWPLTDGLVDALCRWGILENEKQNRA